MQDERLLPTPYATLVYFVRLLIDGKLAQAEKLVRDPARCARPWRRAGTSAASASPGSWSTARAERGGRAGWRFASRPAGGEALWRDLREARGRWIIDNWFEPGAVARHYPSRDHAARHARQVAGGHDLTGHEATRREAPGREAADDEEMTTPGPRPLRSIRRPRGARAPGTSPRGLLPWASSRCSGRRSGDTLRVQPGSRTSCRPRRIRRSPRRAIRWPSRCACCRKLERAGWRREASAHDRAGAAP